MLFCCQIQGGDTPVIVNCLSTLTDSFVSCPLMLMCLLMISASISTGTWATSLVNWVVVDEVCGICVWMLVRFVLHLFVRGVLVLGGSVQGGSVLGASVSWRSFRVTTLKLLSSNETGVAETRGGVISGYSLLFNELFLERFRRCWNPSGLKFLDPSAFSGSWNIKTRIIIRLLQKLCRVLRIGASCGSF